MTGPTGVPLIYDAGALIAAEADDRAILALHRTALTEARLLVVPTPVLAQVWRDGARQAKLSQLLRGCLVEPTAEPVAKRAGLLLGSSQTTDAVDAIVVATAFVYFGAIVTSDPDDLTRLIDAAEQRPTPYLIRL